MASVNICDRCNSMVKGVALGLVQVVNSSEPGTERTGYEVCPACIEDVLVLMGSKPEEGTRKAAYSEPFRPAQKGLTKSNVDELAELMLEKLRREQKAIEG